MEINITWNVCRICLQEQNSSVSASMDINADMAEQILEMTGVMIKTNDSLPQKICRKCLQVLKQAVHFRTTCRVSDKYLQNILEKAKSFKLDKPNKSVFDDIIEEETEGEQRESNIIYKNAALELEPQQKKKKYHEVADLNDKDILQGDKESTLDPTENDLLISPPEETLTKSNIDFGSMFLNNESDLEADELNDPKEADEDVVDRFTQTAQENDKENPENTNFLQYKSLEVSLDSTEEDVQDEMMQSSNLSTVDMASNDDNDELFFIFSDDVITKQEDNNTKDDTILVENMSDMVDTIAEASDEERNFDEFIDSESNTLDPIDFIDEDLIKCEGISGETTSNNENENYYQQDEFMPERTAVQYKPQYIQQNINELDTSGENRYIMKPAQLKPINFDCQICGNHFNSRSLLKYHLKIIHRNERNYECELCGKRFTAACNLTTHMRTHTGEKPFVCQYCQRRFSDKSTHVKHERSHTDERPYSCTICQKAFTLSSSLKAHKRVHTGEKPYSCTSCGKSFKLPHQLKAHMSTNAHKIRSEEEMITPN